MASSSFKAVGVESFDDEEILTGEIYVKDAIINYVPDSDEESAELSATVLIIIYE